MYVLRSKVPLSNEVAERLRHAWTEAMSRPDRLLILDDTIDVIHFGREPFQPSPLARALVGVGL